MSDFQRKSLMVERVIRTGAVNFVRNAWLSVAAIAVMVITLTIMLFSIIANATFAHSIQQLTDRIDVSIYLKDTVIIPQRDDLLTKIKQLPNTKSVKYISKDEALVSYKQQNAQKPNLLLALSQTDNPLPASIQIKPKDPNKLSDFKTFLDKKDVKDLQSDETSYSGDRKEAIDKITSATHFLQQAGLAGMVVFTLISMLIIFNTIRMAIFNRRDELSIMRLLGASTWYIRSPFIVETIMYGVVAALISVLLCQSLFNISASAFGASSLGLLDISFANEYFLRNYWSILGAQILIGLGIGAASSYFATHKYLKFKAPH
jgi:cell division transport system permease protein